MTLSTTPWGRDLPRSTSAKAQAQDWEYWQNRMNRASLVMLAEAGIITRDEAGTIGRAQLAVESEQAKPGAEPLTDIMPLEKMLIARCGQMATLIHTGRSRQDMFATLNQGRLRLSVLDFARCLNGLRRRLLTMAQEHVTTWMPAYTNGVQAMPVSFGFYLWAFLDSFQRDFDRLREAWPRVNRSALGSAVMANSSWPIDRPRLADLLGFDGPVVNGMDSSQVSLIDVPLEAAAIAQNVAVRITTLMQDIAQQYAQTRPWMLLESSSTYSSSAMPQKRNPGVLQKTRAKASDVIGAAQTAVIRAHNLQLGMYDCKESVSEDNTAVLVQGVHMLRLADAAFSVLRVSPERALEELNNDWTCSMALAETLQHVHALPFRVGHGFASDIVTVAREKGFLPETFPYAAAVEIYAAVTKRLDWEDTALPLTEEAFRQSLRPENVIARLQGVGSPAPATTAAGLEAAGKALEDDETWLRGKQDHLDGRETALDALFAALVGEDPKQ